MIETRTLLLDLGEKAVRSRGFAGFSYADLARDAGIRKASIHHHFPTKADFGVALIQRYSENLDQTLEQIRNDAGNAGEALINAIALYRTAIEDGSSACLCAALSTDTALLSEEACDVLESANSGTLAWFSTVFQAAKNDQTIKLHSEPEEEAAATLALLQGAQLLAKASRSGDAFDKAVLALKSRIKG